MNFREYVESLRAQKMLLEVRQAVAPQEIPALVLAEENGSNRPLLFANITGCPSRVVANLLANEDRISRALGEDNLSGLFKRLEHATTNPRTLRRIAWPEEDYTAISRPDLTQYLPQVRHCQEDATPYLTSGVALARHPVSGRSHLCFLRASIQGGNRLLVNPSTPRIKEIVDHTLGRGREMEMVILVGAPFEVLLMGCLSLPDGVDELEVAQALGGESLGFDAHNPLVPVGSEMVLLGRVLPEYQPEGPFGDFKGLYSARPSPVCVIDELRQKKNPIYHFIRGGTSREHIELLVMKAKTCLDRLKQQEPSLMDYHLPLNTGGRLCVLTVADDCRAECLQEALFDTPLVRCFILVNEDVDPSSASDVLWAFTQRAIEAEDFEFQPQPLRVGPSGKLIVNATKKGPTGWGHRRVEVLTSN